MKALWNSTRLCYNSRGKNNYSKDFRFSNYFTAFGRERYGYRGRTGVIIKTHIARFKLNDRQQKTEQLIKFLRDIINNEGRYTSIEYNNMIVELFVKRLEGKTVEEILKICSTIYEYAVVKFYT